METNLLRGYYYRLLYRTAPLKLPAIISCLEAERQTLLEFSEGVKILPTGCRLGYGMTACQWQGLDCDNQTPLSSILESVTQIHSKTTVLSS